MKPSPIYMTRAVFDLIERAVNNPKWLNDWRGVWHDILWMSRMYHPTSETTTHFYCIVKGAGRKSKYAFTAECGPTDIDNPAPLRSLKRT